MTPQEEIELRARLAAAEQERDKMAADLKKACGLLAKAEDRLENMRIYANWLRRRVYGRMSERRLPADPESEPTLPDLDDAGLEQYAQELYNNLTKEAEYVEKVIRTKADGPKPHRRPIDTGKLPVEVEDIYPECAIDEDGKLKEGFVEIGKEESTRLEMVPAMMKVVKTVRHKVMRTEDQKLHPEDRKIITPPVPAVGIPKCMAGPTVLADVIIGKFMYHLPFYRQRQQYHEIGLDVPESTMCGWFEAAVEQLNKIYTLLRSSIMTSGYIHVDESTIPVIDNEKKRARKGYMWCVRDGMSGNVVFYYDLGKRSGEVARRLLDGYVGWVQTDGYEVYSQYEDSQAITLVGCWAHVRRKFFEAKEYDEKTANEFLDLIGELYDVEREAKENDLSPLEISDLRKRRSLPVIGNIKARLKVLTQFGLMKNAMAKAVNYADKLMPRLERYVYNGYVNIDNNPVENAIRPLALGRKNFLFCGNDAAAERAAIAYSFISTCKAAGVDPREWLTDMMRRLPRLPKSKTLAEPELIELLPAEWKKRHS